MSWCPELGKPPLGMLPTPSQENEGLLSCYLAWPVLPMVFLTSLLKHSQRQEALLPPTTVPALPQPRP